MNSEPLDGADDGATVLALRSRRGHADNGNGPGAGPPPGWLPPGRSCAICFSIDDVHPATAADDFDAGGDLERGVLGRVLRLLRRHERLRVSLCVTPDWRARTPYPTRRLLAALPGLSRLFYLAERWPQGTMRLDRHPEFVAFLKAMPRTEIVPHGLHHIQRGPRVPVEFERASYDECRAALDRAAAIMAAAGLQPAPGHVPPSWAAPPALRRAMRDSGLRFLVSARDLATPVARDALTAMSGMAGRPLIFPAMTEEGLVHIPVNFQATSGLDRALAILEAGGLLSIKAHVAKTVGRYTALDGLDRVYANYLDALFAHCEARFGDRIWWASLGEVAERFAAAAAPARAAAAS